MMFSRYLTISFSIPDPLLERPEVEFVRSGERMLAMQIHVADRIEVP
jgi:hypothetical protein